MVRAPEFDLIENIQDCELNHQLVPKIVQKYDQKLKLEELFVLYKQNNAKKMDHMRDFLSKNKIKVRKRFSFFGKKVEGSAQYRSLSTKKTSLGATLDTRRHSSVHKRSISVLGGRERSRNQEKGRRKLNYSYSGGTDQSDKNSSISSLKPIVVRKPARKPRGKRNTLF